jgi:hypothetical protein
MSEGLAMTDEPADELKVTAQLTYRSSTIVIRLGDYVTYRAFPFLRRKPAVVHYVPGQSPPHREMTDNGLSYWAIRRSDGSLIAWPHLPGQLQASRWLSFVSRGEDAYQGLQPHEPSGMYE